MKTQGSDTAEDTIRKLDEQLRKYKYMEINLLAKKKRYVLIYSYASGWWVERRRV